MQQTETLPKQPTHSKMLRFNRYEMPCRLSLVISRHAMVSHGVIKSLRIDPVDSAFSRKRGLPVSFKGSVPNIDISMNNSYAGLN